MIPDPSFDRTCSARFARLRMPLNSNVRPLATSHAEASITVSIALPIVVLRAGTLSGGRSSFPTRMLSAQTLLLVVSALLARFMWRRAHGVGAKFVTIRIEPDDDPR